MLGDLNKLKVVELKAELATRGLDTKGVKAVLVERLKAALEEEGEVAPVSASASGVEDPRSSQESNDEADEILSSPGRRGRRATSTKDVQPEPLSSDNVEQNEVLHAAIEEEQAPSFAPQEEQTPSPAPIEEESPAPMQFQEQEQDSPHPQEEEGYSPAVGLAEQPSAYQENQFSSVPAESEESSESKESSEDCTAEQHAVEESPVIAGETESLTQEESSSVPEQQEESKPFIAEPCEDLEAMDQDINASSHCTEEVQESQESTEPIITEGTHESMDIKVEPPDFPQVKVEDGTASEVLDGVKEEQTEGSRRARKSRFTDNDDATQGATEVKEEPTDSDTIPGGEETQIKVEPSNDRKRRRSSSRSPRRSRSPPVRRQEDEPEIDESSVLLSWYDSDLNLVIDKAEFLTAAPMHQQGFGYVWAGARASYGFCKGKVCYEAKCLENLDVSHLEDEPNPHVLRVGWSVQGTSMQLGEEKNSFGYGGTGKGSVNCQFKDYGKVFGVGDTVTAYLDMDSEPKVLTFSVNGEPQGVAYEVSSEALEGKALFPHILSKNVKFSVNFSGEPAHPLMEGFSLAGSIPAEDRVAGPKRPEKKEDCEMIMMCGLPGSGKTFWANQHAAENPDKLYNILGTNNLIDKMKVMGLPRKRNYSGRWEVLIDKCTKCLSKLFDVAGRRRRNYILDQTNVYPSAVRRKMKCFDGFKRRAIVIVPADDEFQRRVAKREAEEGKDVPDHAVLEMKANFKAPEVGEIFSEVVFTELPEEEAKAMVETYREEAKQKGVVAQTHQSKRFKSERSGSSGDRRFDDRHGSRDNRDYRDRRDYRDNRDNRDYRDRGNYRPRGGPGGDRNRSGWQPRGGPGGGWRDRNDSYRGGRPDNRGSWRSGGGRGGMGGGYDRHRGGGYNQGRGGYGGGRGGSKGWGYNQGSGGSSWGSWNQGQQDYSQQWQGQNQGQTSGYSTSWKGYGQQQASQHQGYGQQTGYSTPSYSSYGNGSNAYNWNQQYYQGYGGWGQQAQGGTSTSAAVTGTGTAASSAAAPSTAAYDPYQQWNQFSSSYGYSTSSGSTAAGATGSAAHGGK